MHVGSSNPLETCILFSKFLPEFIISIIAFGKYQLYHYRLEHLKTMVHIGFVCFCCVCYLYLVTVLSLRLELKFVSKFKWQNSHLA